MFEISLVVLAIGSIPDNKIIFIVFAEHESVKIEALSLLSSIQGCVSKVSASFNLFCHQFDFLCFPQEIFLNEFNCRSKMWHGIDFV